MFFPKIRSPQKRLERPKIFYKKKPRPGKPETRRKSIIDYSPFTIHYFSIGYCFNN